MPNVAIQGVGVVQFPDNMAPDAIQHAIETDILPKASAEAAPKPSPSANLLPGEGALRQFAHGASFGFDAKLAGLVSAATGGDYQSARDAYEREADAYRVENPKTSFALNLAGGVATGTGLAGTVGKLAAAGRAATAAGGVAAPAEQAAMNVAQTFSEGPKWWQLAKIGGAAGAAQGVGEAQDTLGSYVGGAAKGAALGAATGVILPTVVGAGAKALDATVGAGMRQVVNALRTPEGQADRLVMKALERDGITPTELQSKLRDLGPNATLADAGGRNVLGLADYATQIPGAAKEAGMTMLEDRARGAGGRVMQSLTRNAGVNSTNVDAAVQQLHQNMRAIAANEGYDQILNTGAADMTGNLGKLMEAPTMKAALGRAYSQVKDDIALGRADKTTEQYFDVGPDGKISGFTQVPTLRVLDYVKRSLDGMINDGVTPTGKLTSEAEKALALKRGLLENIDNINPDYARVRGLYADEKAGESAVNLGRKFLSEDSEVTARQLGDMSDAERQYFKLGAARAIQDKIFGASDTGMAYEQFMNRPNNVAKLKAAFGDDPQGFSAFMKDLANEVRMGGTFARLRGNSQTAARLAVAQDAGSPIAGANIPVTKEGLARRLAISLTKPSDEVSGRLADLLLTQDPAKQTAAISKLQAIGPSLNRRMLPPNTAQAAAFLLGKTAGGR